MAFGVGAAVFLVCICSFSGCIFRSCWRACQSPLWPVNLLVSLAAVSKLQSLLSLPSKRLRGGPKVFSHLAFLTFYDYKQFTTFFFFFFYSSPQPTVIPDWSVFLGFNVNCDCLAIFFWLHFFVFLKSIRVKAAQCKCMPFLSDFYFWKMLKSM